MKIIRTGQGRVQNMGHHSEEGEMSSPDFIVTCLSVPRVSVYSTPLTPSPGQLVSGLKSL